MQKVGWFSSLRRQSKSAAKLKQQNGEKKLQKSCIDLTTSRSGSSSPSHISDQIVDPLRLVKCDKCQRLFEPVAESAELVNNAINCKIGAKYSQSGATTINKTINIDKVEEVRQFKDSATEFTEKITITRKTVVTKPIKKIEFFEVNGENPKVSEVSVQNPVTTTTTTSTYNNRNGLVFDDNGRVLNSLNFDFEYIDTDNVIDKPKSPIDPSWVLISDADKSRIANIGSPVPVHRSPEKLITANICDNCRKNANNKFKSKSEWNLSSSKQIKDELFEVVTEMEGLESQEESKSTNKDKQMSIGRKKFNMDPKKGIEYLRENHLIRMDPQDVANFLYKGEGLNKTAIGDYLGEKNDFNEQVLKAFVELHDFTNLILVQALRQFLWSFRLPGEAQKIDRMMECFAQRYCQLNPDIFTNTDTCYVLSFAIIMLNTSLHNPSVKDKPTVEQFISMNRGINNGGDLPRELLESLYDSIRTEPFKIPQDDGNDLMHTFFNPDKEGWLWKQGGRYKSWKRRWFILNDNCLYYFEYTTDKEPRGIIPLENISVREIQDRNKPHCFELFASGGADIIKACKTDSEGKVVEGKHTVYRMSAATEEDKQEWIKCLAQSISHNPFYDILVQRKKKALAKS